MTSAARPSRGVSTALSALLAWMVFAAPALARPWRVLVRGADATRAADPVLSGGVLLVDLAALASSLGLVTRVSERAVAVRGVDGVEWYGYPGEPQLTAPGRTLRLDRPIRVEGRSAWLPAAAVSELAGLRLVLDPDGGVAAFEEAGAVVSGWETFTLAKTPEEIRAGAPQSPSAPAWSLVLPPDHEILRVGLGVGWVPGADWGSDLSASGSVRGIETAVSAFATSGPLGTDLASGHASLRSRDRGWGGEAGDLFSEIWGFARGLRLFRETDREDGRRRSLSLYLEDDRTGYEETVLAYGDEVRIGRSTALGGELGSDGSWLVRSRFRSDRLSLYGYVRDAASRFDGTGAGFSGAFESASGVGLQGSASRSGRGEDRIDTGTLSLRLPVRRFLDLTLESSGVETVSSRGRVDGLGVALPVRGVDLRARYQVRQSELLGVPGRRFLWTQDEAFITASFFAHPRLRLELQLASRWPELGEREDHGQLRASYTILPRTTVSLFATASSLPLSEPFHLRVEHELRSGFALLAEYGQISTFQPVAGEDPLRFKLMIRRTWEVETPAGGAVVQGRVESPGRPAEGVPVELGPYRTVTDEGGRYAFRNIPFGSYEVRVPEKGLPAGYVSGARAVQVERRGEERVDLPLVRLAEVRGWVYVDRNGNGRRDPGEGESGIVLRLDERATASGPDGAFGFHNVPPGTHDLRIDTGRLRRGLTATVPSRIALGLPPGGEIDSVELRLARVEKPVVFEETGR